MHRFRVVSKSWNLPIENDLKLNLENKSCENRRIRSLKGKIIATFSGFFVNFRHSKSGTKMVVNHFKTQLFPQPQTIILQRIQSIC